MNENTRISVHIYLLTVLVLAAAMSLHAASPPALVGEGVNSSIILT